METFLILSYQIGNQAPFDPEAANYITVGVDPGTEFDIIHNGKPHKVHVYDNDHSVPCRSYGFKVSMKSLKLEYRGLEGRQLGALRKAGTEIEDYSFVPQFVYIGDTTERVFEMNPELFEYPSIIVECTFLYDDDLEQATITNHCHWSRLRL